VSNSIAFKLAAQRKKAMSLVGAIDSVALRKRIDPRGDAMRIVLLIDGEWKREEKPWLALSILAGVNPPSDETKAIVREHYAARVRAPRQEVRLQ
jgi:hypothetical protein